VDEHRKMHEFLCMEMNIGFDTEGYEDWYYRFRRQDTAERIRSFLFDLAPERERTRRRLQ